MEGRSRAIGFCRTDCFAWDEEAFERLARSYAEEGRTEDDAWRGLDTVDDSRGRHPG